MHSRRSEESPVWIAYADFLTTLVVLFFVMTVSFAGRLVPGRPGFVVGRIRGSLEGNPISGCLIRLGPGRQARSTEAGNFGFRVDSLREPTNAGLGAECSGYADYNEIVTVRPGDTTVVAISLQKVERL